MISLAKIRRKSPSPLGDPTGWPICCQVWSITKFNSVDFSQSRIILKSASASAKVQGLPLSCFWWCPGTTTPRTTHLTVSLLVWSSRSNARGKLKGAGSVQKALQGSELLGETEDKSISPNRGHSFFPSRQIWFFLLKGNRKNELVAKPAVVCRSPQTPDATCRRESLAMRRCCEGDLDLKSLKV